MSNEPISDKEFLLGAKAFRGLLLFMVPIIAATSSAVGTYFAMSSRITNLRHRVDIQQTRLEGKLEGITKRLSDIHKRFDDHAGMGANGIPHPNGLLVEIAKIKRDIDRLKGEK